MPLTIADDTELLLPLFAGMHEGQRFATFLDRLRQRTGADYIGLFFRQGDLAIHDVTEFHSGRNLRADARRLGLDRLDLLDRFPFDGLQPGRVYAVSEFADVDAEYAAFRARYIGALGIADERIVRLALDGGISAWLLLARGAACTAADGALLANLAPYVALALRGFVHEERRRIEVEMNAVALARSGIGWLLLDREARLLAGEPGLTRYLSALPGFALRPGERLVLPNAAGERILAETAARFARHPQAPVRALELCAEPRVHTVLAPSSTQPAAASSLPVLQVICRRPRRSGPLDADVLAQLTGLSRREAELAVRLSAGRSIAEAAGDMGLTLETARNYTKRIYAQLDLRGQGDLIRHVLQSGVILV